MYTDYPAPSSSALSSLSLCLRSVSLCQSRKRATRGKKVARGKTDSLILLLADRGNRYNRVDASSFSTYNEPESPVDSKKIKNIRGSSTAIRENAKEAEEISLAIPVTRENSIFKRSHRCRAFTFTVQRR